MVSVTGGGAGDMSIAAVKTCFAWCHGFTLPFHAAVRPGDVDGDRLVSERLFDRIRRIAHDVVRYAPLLQGAFEQARALGSSAGAGMAVLSRRRRGCVIEPATHGFATPLD